MKIHDEAVELLERVVKAWLAKRLPGGQVSAYRFSVDGSLRLRVVHPAFLELTPAERTSLTHTMFDGLVPGIDFEIGMVLLLPPGAAYTEDSLRFSHGKP